MYRCKAEQLRGSSLDEIMKQARRDYHTIQKRSPRRAPYVRSSYFRKDKVFINNFWDHLNQKSPRERVRRLKLYRCAIELIRNNTYASDSFQNPVNADEMLHRFYGISGEGQKFAVQIKDNKKTNRKDFLSVFPTK